MRISDWSSDVCSSDLAAALAARVEAFVREQIIPYASDARRDSHGPLDSLVAEMPDKARAAGLLTPHIRADGSNLNQRATARVLHHSDHSPLPPLALHPPPPHAAHTLLLARRSKPTQ